MRHAFTRFETAKLLPVIAAFWMLSSPDLAHAGNGSFKNGDFDFCVSVRFNATAEQLARIRTTFENGSQVLADATDGQHKFSRVTIVNDSGASQAADYWVHPGEGRADATFGHYGMRGEHVNLYFDTNFQAVNGADGDAYTIAHEHAHHAYDVRDEYSGPAGEAECAPPPDSSSVSFSLMDNYLTRGGRAAAGPYTLNEFCVPSNHDPDGDTFQETVKGRSAWETIASHETRAATAPLGLPVDAPPPPHTVAFEDGADDLHVMLLVDRSGSMAVEGRLEFAQRSAKVFLDQIDDGETAGVASFADLPSVDFAPVTLDAAARTAQGATIDRFVASGATNIGGGLLSALGEITRQTARSCNEIVVLLSDGDHNTGTTPEAALPSLKDERVTVLTVGVGGDLSTQGEATLQQIAAETGGKFFRVGDSRELILFLMMIAYESQGNGLVTHAPTTIASGERQEVPVLIESGAAGAVFALAISESNDELTFSVRSPSGALITEATAATDPDVEFIADANSKVFRVASPEAGEWHAIVEAGDIVSGAIDVLGFVKHDGVQLGASVSTQEIVRPLAIQVEATPRFEGQAVVGAAVAGEVVRPDGTRVSIELFDDGLAEHGDSVAGDGVYAARFADYTTDGTYTFELEVRNATGTVVPGESLFAQVGPNTMTVPAFQRMTTTTAVVSSAPGILASRDSILRLRSRNTNEGANPLLVVGGSAAMDEEGTRFDPVDTDGPILPDLLGGPSEADSSIVAFDLNGVPRSNVTRATLVVTVDPRLGSSDWGRKGGSVAAYGLSNNWTEGNGRNLALPLGGRALGSGAGVTWNCASDVDVADAKTGCAATWKGGEIAPQPTSIVPHVNGLAGKVRFDVTADVVGGFSSWQLRRRGDRGIVHYVSREGAVEAGDPERGPLLVAEVGP